MQALLKRFLAKFLLGFVRTLIHDPYARVLDGVTIGLILLSGLVVEHQVFIVTSIIGVSIVAVVHGFRTAFIVSTEVAAEIRSHKFQVDSPYIYAPSGKPALIDISEPAVPRHYKSLLYGAALVVLCLSFCVSFSTWEWQHRREIRTKEALVAPDKPPQTEQPLRVFVQDFISNQLFRFWLVRQDVKQYFPADIFTVMRFTNLTNDEIMLEALNVELLEKGEAPIKLFLLVPDNVWHTYDGMSTSSVVPCTFDKEYMSDVLRQPIGPGHTVYGVGLFQIQQGKSFSKLGGIRLHVSDVRGKQYDIDAVIPAETPAGSLEGLTIRNSHPMIDISKYAEQRPAFD